MTKSEERNIFLKYLVRIYIQNPNLPINSDTIYDELRKFNIEGNKQSRINNESLVGIQVKLNNKFMGNCFSDGYFWVIENRKNVSDKDFYNSMYQSIKLYVSIDAENLYHISEKLFNFMLEENIMMQCKIAKEMRNDVLILKVQTKEDAIKVSNYLNKLNYKSKIKPNPFLLDNGKTSMAMDRGLSYNSTLSKLIENYLKFRKSLNTLNDVSEKDFANFIKIQISELKQNKNPVYLNIYGLTNEDKLNDFIMIGELIQKNIDKTLTQKELFQYQNKNEVKSESQSSSVISYTQEEKEKILYLINKMSQYYSLEEVHTKIMSYINTGKSEYFTRRDGIRYIVESKFSPNRMKEIISDLGWNAIISATNTTLKKYGTDQVYYALKKLLDSNDITAFTNENDARSYLGFIIPPELLREVLVNKLRENNYNLTSEAIINLIFNEINEREKAKMHGRK